MIVEGKSVRQMLERILGRPPSVQNGTSAIMQRDITVSRPGQSARPSVAALVPQVNAP